DCCVMSAKNYLQTRHFSTDGSVSSMHRREVARGGHVERHGRLRGVHLDLEVDAGVGHPHVRPLAGLDRGTRALVSGKLEQLPVLGGFERSERTLQRIRRDEEV